MIHHLSVSAADPKGAAEFFADLMGGVVVDFPPNPGSYMVFKADGHGTGIEIYPAGSVMLNPPGTEHSVWTDMGCVVLIQWDRPVIILEQEHPR